MTELADVTGGSAAHPVQLLPGETPAPRGFVPSGVARFIVTGAVLPGHKRGRLLGFPTANVRLAPGEVPQGVWFGAVTLDDGRRLPAAVSVGRRATFQEDTNDDVLLEAHLLDFDEDIYGMSITVALYRTIRAQRGYRRVQELIDQLGCDIESVRRWAAHPDRRRTDAIPSWAMLRAESAVRKQLAMGRGVPDSKTLAQLSGLSKHLAKRCLAQLKEPDAGSVFSGTIGTRHRRGR